MSAPTDEQIWEQVRAFAAQCNKDKTPIFTLKRGVRNFITAVTDTRIERDSDDGRKDQTQSWVSKRNVIDLWHFLNGTAPDPKVLYFTYALMAAALPDLLEVSDGQVGRKVPSTKKAPKAPQKPRANYEREAASVWDILCQKAEAGEPTSYLELGAATGIHYQNFTNPLGLIEKACEQQRVPRLAALVGAHKDKVPGRGYISEDGYSFEEERERVYAYPWKLLANPFNYARGGETEESLAQRVLADPDQPLEVYRRVRVRGPAQAIFRTALLEAYGRACAFCGFAVTESLEAAHIHPWAKCAEKDRINPCNGLLLCANHHRMFDAQQIFVTPAYEITCATSSVAEQLSKFPIYRELRLPKLVQHYPDPHLLVLRHNAEA